MKKPITTEDYIKAAPECDERCPYCLISNNWKCIDAQEYSGHPEYEIEYTYECQTYDHEFEDICGGRRTAIVGPDWERWLSR